MARVGSVYAAASSTSRPQPGRQGAGPGLAHGRKHFSHHTTAAQGAWLVQSEYPGARPWGSGKIRGTFPFSGYQHLLVVAPTPGSPASGASASSRLSGHPTRLAQVVCQAMAILPASQPSGIDAFVFAPTAFHGRDLLCSFTFSLSLSVLFIPLKYRYVLLPHPPVFPSRVHSFLVRHHYSCLLPGPHCHPSHLDHHCKSLLHAADSTNTAQPY